MEFDTHFTQDNPHSELWGQYKNMMLNWQKMERLSQYYDKVWLVESDIIPPPDALAKLLETGASVVSGLIASRHAPYEPSIGRKIREQFSWAELKSMQGQTIQVGASATGCTLIDRTVLDRYHIDMAGYEDKKEYNKSLIDVLFSTWCNENNIKQMARLDVLCGHKKANGEILWPQDYMN